MARKMDFLELISFWRSHVEETKASGRSNRRIAGDPLEEGVFYMVDESCLFQLSDDICES